MISDVESDGRSSVGSCSSAMSRNLPLISDQLRLALDDSSDRIYTDPEQNLEQEKLVEDPAARRKRFYASAL